MITSLFIQNLILIEKATIEFGSGFNIITGETGAGKSAVLAAIRLLLGERADGELIRQGADLCIVEATVSGTVIRRELHRSGRSRCFVQDSQVSLQELRVFLSTSIELVDQSSSHKLSLPEHQRDLLDTYARLSPIESSFNALAAARHGLDELSRQKESSGREQKRLEENLAYAAEVNWKSGEEEQLGIEHRLLSHSQELLEKLGTAAAFLSEIIAPLKRFSHQIEHLRAIDFKLEEPAQSLKNSGLELEETSRFLATYNDSINIDPSRLGALEKRISELETLKKRFNVRTHEELEKFRAEWQRDTEKIAHLEPAIEEKTREVAEFEQTVDKLAKELSAQRKKAAEPFAKAIQSELRSLNLPHARFSIELLPKPLSATGLDQIRYLFSANPNQPLLPLDECASGGELSRLLFAIKIVLAEREQATCLIFDEIDSNIGGQTATLLGAKLQALGSSRQLICVTHFVQVATRAQHHLLVSKQTTPAGARTLITSLLAAEREREYSRMMGC